MKKIKVLNLYCGIGGNRKLWENVEVTAVEFNEEIASVYKYFFPSDKVIVTDAHQFLLEHFSEFDFIWSSPPCQTHSQFSFMCSKMKPGSRGNGIKKFIDFKLWQEIIFLKSYAECSWVVENVIPYYDPLVSPTVELQRHLFWSNFKINKTSFIEKDVFDIKTSKSKTAHFDLSSFDIKHRKDQILNNCVNPDLGLYVFEQYIGYTRQKKTNQLSLL